MDDELTPEQEARIAAKLFSGPRNTRIKVEKRRRRFKFTPVEVDATETDAPVTKPEGKE